MVDKQEKEKFTCHECGWELTQFQQCEHVLKDMPNFKQVKTRYERNAKRLFSKSGLCRHLNIIHRDDNTENPIHCLKCGKALNYKEETWCSQCRKEIDADMETDFNAGNEIYTKNEDEQVFDDIQIEEMSDSWRFKNSRGQSVFKL